VFKGLTDSRRNGISGSHRNLKQELWCERYTTRDLVLDPCRRWLHGSGSLLQDGPTFIGCDIVKKCVEDGHCRLAERKAARQFFLGGLAENGWRTHASGSGTYSQLAQDMFGVHFLDLPLYLFDLSEHHQRLLFPGWQRSAFGANGRWFLAEDRLLSIGETLRHIWVLRRMPGHRVADTALGRKKIN